MQLQHALCYYAFNVHTASLLPLLLLLLHTALPASRTLCVALGLLSKPHLAYRESRALALSAPATICCSTMGLFTTITFVQYVYYIAG
jgi:hypothetical protein